MPTLLAGLTDLEVLEDAPATIVDLSGLFGDVDIASNGDLLTYTVTESSNPGLLLASVAGNSLALEYQAHLFGSALITVRATDGSGEFVEDTVQVTVAAVNDPPVVSSPIGAVAVAEESTATVLNLSALFADVDSATNGDVVALSLVGNDNVTLGQADLSGNLLTLVYGADQNGTATLTLRGTDASGAFV